MPSHRLGPIELAPGVERRHVLTYLFAAFLSIGLFAYITAMSPYIFGVHLQVPESEQGRLSGYLHFWQEIALLLVIGWWGALSDRIGRRAVYVAGFAVLAVAYAIYPFAETTSALLAFRLVFAVGVAAASAMLATVVSEYTAESSRARLMGVSFFLNGLGSVLFFVFLTRLPYAFQSQGAAPIEAGRYAFLCVAGIAAIAAIAMLGLKPGRPASVPPRASIARLLAEGVAAARNPRIALAYGSAFTARADMGMITLFLTLWMVQAGVVAGADTAAATARAGALAGIAQGTALVSAPLFGIVGDRIDRVTLLAIAFAFAAVGYAWVGVTGDILAPGAIPALICLGIGQVGTILASTVLMGQEAPASHRGAIFGVQSFCGALGILAISAVGGWLFDRVGPGAPFVLIGIANAVVLGWAILVRLSARRSGAPRSHPASAADS